MIVAGIGFNTSATPKSLALALEAAMQAAGVARLDALASVHAKAAAPPLIAFATARALPLLSVDVAGVPTPSHSPRVMALFGTGCLAEAAALVGAGAGTGAGIGARLLSPKTKSPCGRATCAIAISKDQS